MVLKVTDDFQRGILVDALLRFLECTLTPESRQAVEGMLKDLGIDRKEAKLWIEYVWKEIFDVKEPIL